MSYQVDGRTQNQGLLAGTVSQTSAQIDIADASVPVTVIRDTYIEYNFFVRQYNNDANRNDTIYMKFVPTSRLFRQPSCRQLIIFIILAIVPFVCFATFVCMVYRLIGLIRINLIVKSNRRAVRNPFQRMVYCAPLSKLNWYFDISSRINYEELTVLGISTQNIDIAAAQYRNEILQGKTFRVMFYNAQFASYERNVVADMCGRLYLTLTLLAASIVGIVFSFIIIAG